jgi:hypothetical protein
VVASIWSSSIVVALDRSCTVHGHNFPTPDAARRVVSYARYSLAHGHDISFVMITPVAVRIYLITSHPVARESVISTLDIVPSGSILLLHISFILFHILSMILCGTPAFTRFVLCFCISHGRFPIYIPRSRKIFSTGNLILSGRSQRYIVCPNSYFCSSAIILLLISAVICSTVFLLTRAFPGSFFARNVCITLSVAIYF